jgi:phage FluMu protein Com
MSRTVSCPGCKNLLALTDQMVGQKAKCPRCGTIFQVRVNALGPSKAQPAPRPPEKNERKAEPPRTSSAPATPKQAPPLGVR